MIRCGWKKIGRFDVPSRDDDQFLPSLPSFGFPLETPLADFGAESLRNESYHRRNAVVDDVGSLFLTVHFLRIYIFIFA